MLRSMARPSIGFDIIGLAGDGLVTVGRESESSIRLDSPEVPFLLSRRHATIQLQPDGNILLKDLSSTNGTYAARRGQTLRKLQPHTAWQLQSGDTIGFGGPETIVAHRVHVSNPFLFKFYDDEMEEGTNGSSAAVQQAPGLQQVQADATMRASNQGPQEMDVVNLVDDEPVHDQDAAARSAGAGPNPLKSAWQAHGVPGVHVRTPAGNKENMPIAAGKMAEILSNHLTCPICQEWLLACHTLSCGHMFCGPCLATWLNQKPSCPSCRKPVAGIPVRCFQVDSAINDLLGINPMSPSSKGERKRKQAQWDDMQGSIVQDWALNINQRRQKAQDAAARHHRSLMQPAAGQQHQQHDAAATAAGGVRGSSADAVVAVRAQVAGGRAR